MQMVFLRLFGSAPCLQNSSCSEKQCMIKALNCREFGPLHADCIVPHFRPVVSKLGVQSIAEEAQKYGAKVWQQNKLLRQAEQYTVRLNRDWVF